MTRKAVALAADVSERHLANLEYGVGNARLQVLLQVAGALQCSQAGRAAFYPKAEFKADTRAQPLQASFARLRRTVRHVQGLASLYA